MLNYIIKRFSCSKYGNSSDENEDAYIAPVTESRGGFLRAAVADGATESSFSKEWAMVLVAYFYGFEYKNENFLRSIHPFLKRSWLDRINANDLPWYAQQKLELGAFASFLGIDVNLENGDCNIIAVGDSNLFIFRNNVMISSFPIERAEDFGNTPFLISSEVNKNNVGEKLFSEKLCHLVAGDTIVIGTDAISQWILLEAEKERNPLEILTKEIENEEGDSIFQKWLDERRRSHLIKNDDTTILLIKFSDGIT